MKLFIFGIILSFYSVIAIKIFPFKKTTTPPPHNCRIIGTNTIIEDAKFKYDLKSSFKVFKYREYSTVFTMKRRETNSKILIVIPCENEHERLGKEFTMLQALNESKYSVKVLKFHELRNLYYMVMEYYGPKSVKNFNEKSSQIERQCRPLMAQILLALEDLHSNNIVLRNFDLDSMLIDENGYIRLSNFEFAKVWKDPNEKFKDAIPNVFMPPSYAEEKEYTKDIDFFMLGWAYYEIMKENPMSNTRIRTFFNQVFATNTPNYSVSEPQIDTEGFSEDLKDLIKGLLRFDVKKRLGYNGIQEIKDHPFFKSFFMTVTRDESNLNFLDVIVS